MTPNLPPPNADQQILSEKLIAKIIAEMNGGAIPFSRYMDMVLYEPGLGYYAAGQQKLGPDGDFITAPELSPLFGYCIANSCLNYFYEHPQDSILEFGAGSGTLTVDIIHQLKNKNGLPKNYFILEVSPDLQERQKKFCKERCGDYFKRIIWLRELPKDFQGIIIANEVLDAMPVEKFKIQNGKMMRMGVTYKNNRFEWVMMEPMCRPEETRRPVHPEEMRSIVSKDILKAVSKLSLRDDPVGPPQSERNTIMQENYESEISTIIPAWLKSITASYLKNLDSRLRGNDGGSRGKIILIDYGFLEHEFYHPQRSQGTLMCHYRHHAHPDPFVYPGLQDITAHVNFSQVGNAAENLGWTVHFETQAEFLLGHGLLEFPNHDLNTNTAIKKLTLPQEMGELFKVMVLTR